MPQVSAVCPMYFQAKKKPQPSESEDATGGLYVHGGISWIKPFFTPFSCGGNGEIMKVNLIRKKKSDPIMDTLQLDPHVKFTLHKSWGKKERQILCSQMLNFWSCGHLFVCSLLNILLNIFFLDTTESTTAEEFPSWDIIWDVQYEKNI